MCVRICESLQYSLLSLYVFWFIWIALFYCLFFVFLSVSSNASLLSVFIYIHRSVVVIIFFFLSSSSSSSSHFLFCFSPTWCHPSPLLSFPPPPTHPSLVCLPSITVSQRHSQTGGGVKRWWAPGNPRGAFQWQRPQVKIPREELLGCSSRVEEK